MSALVNGLVAATRRSGLIQERDVIYVKNRLLAMTGATPSDETTNGRIPELVDRLVDEAVRNGLTEDGRSQRDRFAADMMDQFMPRPSEVERVFYDKYATDPVMATDYFYRLSTDSNYIQTERTKQNISYQVDTRYGMVDITINVSKPEKDPKEIAQQKSVKKEGAPYPKCLLCVENEGYEGRLDHPARANHRLVPLELGGEEWYMQYSPYVYYDEHCILLSGEHRDMRIDRSSFVRLLDFVEKFPHYFAGSNADLPIVGGSILSHDHYQAGRYTFAMAEARETGRFSFEEFRDVSGHTLLWPLSVIRLRSQNQNSLVACADRVLSTWRNYSDEACHILAHTDAPHNTITPIARKKGEFFELDLVLRNNRTTSEHPLGLFHPHADVHHIKRENIGLIEVMGLAVLPARLQAEMDEVKRFIVGETDNVQDLHQDWACELKRAYDGRENIERFIEMAVAEKFVKGLEDCGVFKLDENGQRGLQRFIQVIQSRD